MQVNLLTPGYRLKITRASRMSELVDRVITASPPSEEVPPGGLGRRRGPPSYTGIM